MTVLQLRSGGTEVRIARAFHYLGEKSNARIKNLATVVKTGATLRRATWLSGIAAPQKEKAVVAHRLSFNRSAWDQLLATAAATTSRRSSGTTMPPEEDDF
jgi:hypothetical protein